MTDLTKYPYQTLRTYLNRLEEIKEISLDRKLDSVAVRFPEQETNIALPIQEAINALREEMQGRKKCTTLSKYTGVYWYSLRQKWTARININKKHTSLGYFEDEEEAAKAYDKAARKYFGEFARPNFK